MSQNGIGQMSIIGQNFLPIALTNSLPTSINQSLNHFNQIQLELVPNESSLEITAQQVQLQNILNEHVQSTVRPKLLVNTNADWLGSGRHIDAKLFSPCLYMLASCRFEI